MPESSHRESVARVLFNVMPSLALDSSIHAGMTMIWLEHYSHTDFLLRT